MWWGHFATNPSEPLPRAARSERTDGAIPPRTCSASSCTSGLTVAATPPRRPTHFRSWRTPRSNAEGSTAGLRGMERLEESAVFFVRSVVFCSSMHQFYSANRVYVILSESFFAVPVRHGGSGLQWGRGPSEQIPTPSESLGDCAVCQHHLDRGRDHHNSWRVLEPCSS